LGLVLNVYIMVTQNIEKTIKKQKTTTRSPIVVVLGHVDHGKSSLLEAIREDFRITAKESGGITQHIGAYVVEHAGHTVTFLDTPGHELFSAMRSRGAKVADIAVLVVAADESVKPQTIEAIEQIKKAGIPMVVAINKVDKPEANSDRVKQELAQNEVMVESYGGDVPAVETSATSKQGIKELLDMILLVTELEDLQASVDQPGEGTVIEAHLDSKRGPTATILVGNGKVEVGDFIATGTTHGKVKILEDFKGQSIKKAMPSTPAVVLGFLKAPLIGEVFHILSDERAAQSFVEEHGVAEQEKRTEVVPRGENGERKTLTIILKADVAGSLEALETALLSIPQEEISIHIVESGIGEVGENDVKRARSAEATILGFKTKISAAARDLAEKEKIEIETFEVIYELIERARKLMEQSVEDEEVRKDIGLLNVLAIFLVDKTRQVIGGKVVEGEIKKGLKAEIIREGEVVGHGKVTNVQKDKKDVPTVTQGQECGLSFQAVEKVQEGDQLQFYIEKT